MFNVLYIRFYLYSLIYSTFEIWKYQRKEQYLIPISGFTTLNWTLNLRAIQPTLSFLR
jgi:hypothetical protein